jgi:hypothetical protein
MDLFNIHYDPLNREATLRKASVCAEQQWNAEKSEHSAKNLPDFEPAFTMSLVVEDRAHCSCHGAIDLTILVRQFYKLLHTYRSLGMIYVPIIFVRSVLVL